MASMKEIRESLLRQLEEKDAKVPYAVSLVEDYVFLWNQKNKMQTDIRKNGMTIRSISSQGKEYDKENPSVKMVLLYEKQMLQILKDLNITTDNTIDPNSPIVQNPPESNSDEEDEDDTLG